MPGACMRRAYSLRDWTAGRRKKLEGLALDLDDHLRASVLPDDVGQELLAQVDLRLGVVGGVSLVFHHLEPQVIEGAAHLVEPVLRLHDDLVEALLDRPDFLLLGERAEVPLAAPVAARAADPGVDDAAALEADVVAETGNQVR